MPLSSPRVFDYSDDAAVAKLLADEAKQSSTRYATQGLSALLPKRSVGSAPKPNTRFLKNLVRDADQHNAALRRKEDRDRVERLRNGGLKREIDSDDSRSRSRTDREGHSSREAKRRKTNDVGTEAGDRTDSSRHHASSHRRRHKSEGRLSRSESDEDQARSRKRSPRSSRKKDSRHNGRDGDEYDRRSSQREHRRRSASPSRNPETKHDKRRPPKRYAGALSADRESSSDPLEDIVGPMPANKGDKPAVQYRGRGAHKLAATSNIDDHFSSKYDPALDVQPNAEEADEKEDWDMALEALRDRQAWQKKHADRMRAAGFNDEDIRNWEESGREKDVHDVRWAGKGQTRAWDVGKVDTEDEEDRKGRLTP